MTEANRHSSVRLTETVQAPQGLTLDPAREQAWIDVIQKMDEVYADLVCNQVELEEKNEALEEAQRFIGSVLASMTDVLIVCDVHGRIQQVNNALEQLTGSTEASLKGQPMQELFALPAQPRVSSFLQQIRSGGVRDCEVSVRGRDDDPVPLAMNCSPRHDHRGRLLGMVLIGRPVGELRRAYELLNRTHMELREAQKQLIQSEKMASLGRLVAGVAHELNNPISFVSGNVHALQRYSERLARYVSAVHEGADETVRQRMRRELRIDHTLADMPSLMAGTLEGAARVSEIVQDLRRFSAAERGEKHRVDLIAVVRTAVQWVSKAAKRQLSVQMVLPEQLEVVGYEGRLHQVLVNLAQNAVDATEEVQEPRLEVKAGRFGNRVRVAVRDNGRGLSEQNLLRVFDPFFSTKPVGRGTGLGLYISYGIAADHGGSLSVANHPEGGAEFTLELPAPE